jgi:hypothetical protein
LPDALEEETRRRAGDVEVIARESMEDELFGRLRPTRFQIERVELNNLSSCARMAADVHVDDANMQLLPR